MARRVGRVCDLGALGCAANLGELDVTPEVERAREQSRVFLLAARRCNEFQPPSGYLQFLFVPSLVLYAFAIEVGFKALALHASGAAPRGHDLEALFRALPGELQAQIMADTTATYPGSEPYFDRVGVGREALHARQCARRLLQALQVAPRHRGHARPLQEGVDAER